MMAKNTGSGSRYGAGLRTESFRALGNPQSAWAAHIGTTGRFTDSKVNAGDFAAIAKRRRKNSRRRWFRKFW